MSILGKILAFLNILGVAGFMYLASLVYAKRQMWEYANFRADLIPYGVPIDDKGYKDNGDTDTTGVPRINNFGRFGDLSDVQNDRTFKELFPADRPKLPTQVAEVERVYGKLKALLDATADDPRKKNVLLAQIVQALAGTHQRPEIYVDREFYLSMEAQLGDDEKFEAFKKALADAVPVAVEKVRFDTKKLSFEKEFQNALADLPGEDRWKLAEAFLKKLPREGVTFEQAGEAAKNAAVAVEARAKLRQDAEDALDVAKSAAFVASAESFADPTKEKKDLAGKLEMQRQAAQEKANEAAKPFENATAKAAARAEAEGALRNAKAPEEIAAAKKALAAAVAEDEAAKRETDPRTAAAIAFLQTIRKDDKKTRVVEFVEDVVADTLGVVGEDLNRRFELAHKEAAEGLSTKDDESSGGEAALKLIRERRRQAIARFLLAAIDVLDKEAVEALQKDEKPGAMVDVASYKRLITVVGVDTAIWALNNQQLALAEAAKDVLDRISHEKSSFRDRHQQTLLDLKKRAEVIERLDERVKDIARQAGAQEVIAKGEKERVDGYRKDLEASRGLTTREMDKLVELTNGLDKVRKDIRNAIRDNENHLRRIVALEAEVVSLQVEVAAKEKAEKDRKKRKPMP